MREILFRGQSKRTKNFVYGAYWWNPFTGEHLIKQLCEGGTQFEDVVCTRETIRQFTGLKDKNGVKIFEGDQLSVSPGYYSIIEFKNGSFLSIYKHPEDGEELLMEDIEPHKCEIIGNIHQTK